MAISETLKSTFNKIFSPDPPGLPLYSLKGVPRGVQQTLDDSAKFAGRKVWGGLVQASFSGFGKGVLLMGLLLVGAAAISAGIVAVDAGAVGGFGVAAAAGAAKAVTSLITAGGLMTLAVGGILGAAMDIRQEQTRITAEVAQAQAAAYELTRIQRQQQRELEKPSDLPEVNFAAREAAKRQAMADSAMGK